MLSLLYGPTLTSVHDYLKKYSFDYMDCCQQNDISAITTFLPSSKHLLIYWLQSLSAVSLEPKKISEVVDISPSNLDQQVFHPTWYFL